MNWAVESKGKISVSLKFVIYRIHFLSVINGHGIGRTHSFPLVGIFINFLNCNHFLVLPVIYLTQYAFISI
jgi:hypothetical protein